MNEEGTGDCNNKLVSNGTAEQMCSVAYRNTLLRDYASWHHVSQTCFHCRNYCTPLCVPYDTFICNTIK